MLEKYYKYKIDYKEYVVIIKYGLFYEVIGEDAVIVNEITNYKLKMFNNTLKLGFPINSINKVINLLKEYSINYIIIDEQITKKEFKKNNYYKYKKDEKEVLYKLIKIDKIINKLNNISIDKLIKIEDIINE